jgi:uncharacterized protein YeaO (DUF488 family)
MAKKRSAGSLSAKLDIKRIYAPPDPSDGLRILVDRLWPRGLAKEKAKIDLWLKDIAPSDALRRAVHGKLVDWEQFLAEYARELAQAPAAGSAQVLIEHLAEGPVTLLYAARNEAQNNAVALKDWLLSQRQHGRRQRRPSRLRAHPAKPAKPVK